MTEKLFEVYHRPGSMLSFTIIAEDGTAKSYTFYGAEYDKFLSLNADGLIPGKPEGTFRDIDLFALADITTAPTISPYEFSPAEKITQMKYEKKRVKS